MTRVRMKMKMDKLKSKQWLTQTSVPTVAKGRCILSIKFPAASQTFFKDARKEEGKEYTVDFTMMGQADA